MERAVPFDHRPQGEILADQDLVGGFDIDNLEWSQHGDHGRGAGAEAEVVAGLERIGTAVGELDRGNRQFELIGAGKRCVLEEPLISDRFPAGGGRAQGEPGAGF